MIVYICSPYAGEIKENTEKAKEYCRYAVSVGNVPIAPHLLFPQFMSEETEREMALQMGLTILDKCAEVWVFGERISSGMNAEIAFAKNKKKKIRYFKKAETEDE